MVLLVVLRMLNVVKIWCVVPLHVHVCILFIGTGIYAVRIKSIESVKKIYKLIKV